MSPNTGWGTTQTPPVDASGGASPYAPRFGRALSRHLVLATAVLLLLLHLGNALLVLHFYRAIADRETAAREATATVLAEHASRAVSAIQLALEAIREKLPATFATRPGSLAIQMMIYNHMQALPQVHGILLLDATGRPVDDSRHFPPLRNDLSDRAYFAAQKTGAAGGGIYIGRLMHSRFDDKPFFAVSLPLLDPHGHFLGVIVALAEPSYFSNVYDANVLEPGVVSILARVDGSILAGTFPAAAGRVKPHTLDELFATHSFSDVIHHAVPPFPLQIVLAGPSPASSPAFHNLLFADASAMAALTVIALWFAGILAMEVAARARADNRLHDAIDSVPAGLALYDADDRLVLCNERYRQLAADAFRHIIVPGVEFRDIAAAAAAHPAGAGEPPEAYIARRMRSHREAQGETIQKLPNGFWLLTRDRRTNEGGIVVCHTDITQMKQQEEALRRSEQAERQARLLAERANQAKSAFLATMSHELRTPLNAVIGFSEIINQEMFGPIPPRYQEYNSLILRSGQHLLAVINDILDIAKLQSGKTELHLAPTEIGTLVADTLRFMAKQAEAAQITLDCTIAPDLPEIVVDDTRLRQVLLNLISNAIKFTPAGGRVSVSARCEDGGLVIAVSDTGIGMAEQDIPRALEPFSQIDNSMTRTREGTGLGLPLAKNLVELHGGKFRILSAPGAGTTVILTLPLPRGASDSDDASRYESTG